MSRATCQRISHDLISRRYAGRWVDCMLLQRDDVSLTKWLSGGDTDSAHHFVSANPRMRRLFLQGLGALGKGLA